jgi:hypothetical protein
MILIKYKNYSNNQIYLIDINKLTKWESVYNVKLINRY